MIHEAPELSPRTRLAVQDFTALSTIARAFERWRAGERDELTTAILTALAHMGADAPRPPRLPVDCPLGRRMLALGLLRVPPAGSRGVVGASWRALEAIT